MVKGLPVATGEGLPAVIVDQLRQALGARPYPLYEADELAALVEAVQALATTYPAHGRVCWELVVVPYLQVRLVDGHRSDLVLLTPSR